MSETRYWYGVIILVLLGLISMPVMAQSITAPAVITTPGVYELTGDNRGLTDVYGIKIESSDVILDGNGFFIGGDSRDKSVGVLVNKYGGSITNVTVQNLKLENWESGVSYQYIKGQEGDNNEISNCDIINTPTAIHIEYSDVVTVAGNFIRECSTGIKVEQNSRKVSLQNNTIKGDGVGILLQNTAMTSLTDNTINGCSVYGVQITDSSDLNIVKNNISDNKYAALSIETAQNSTITDNNFSKTEIGPVLVIGNEVRVAKIYNNYFASQTDVSVDNISSNLVWNLSLTPGLNILGGPYLGGNYWGAAPGFTGFSDETEDEDGYGIGDMPYVINSFNTDYLPLVLTNKTAPAPTPEQNDVVASTGSDNTTVTKNTTEENVPVNTSGNNGNVSQAESNKALVESKTPAISVQNEYSLTAVEDDTTTNASEEQKEEPSVVNGTETGLEEETINNAGGNGYLMFSGLIPGDKIILITYTQSEVELDPVQATNMSVPVPSGYPMYSSWKIVDDNTTVSSGIISSYPVTDETIIINVREVSSKSEPESLIPDMTTNSSPEGQDINVSFNQTDYTATLYSVTQAPDTLTTDQNVSTDVTQATITDNTTFYPVQEDTNTSGTQTDYTATLYSVTQAPDTLVTDQNVSTDVTQATITDNTTFYPVEEDTNTSGTQADYTAPSYSVTQAPDTLSADQNVSTDVTQTTTTEYTTFYPVQEDTNTTGTQGDYTATLYSVTQAPDTLSADQNVSTDVTQTTTTEYTTFYPVQEDTNTTGTQADYTSALYSVTQAPDTLSADQNVSTDVTQTTTTEYTTFYPVQEDTNTTGTQGNYTAPLYSLTQAPDTLSADQNISTDVTQTTTTEYTTFYPVQEDTNTSGTLADYTSPSYSVTQAPDTLSADQNVSTDVTQTTTTEYTTFYPVQEDTNTSGTQADYTSPLYSVTQAPDTLTIDQNEPEIITSVNMSNSTPLLVVPTPIPFQPADYNQSTNISLNTSVNQTGPLVFLNGINGTFEEGHTITAYSGPGGVIFPEGSITVKDGEDVTFIITAYEGHTLDYLLIDGVNAETTLEYKFTDVTGDHTIIAGFT